jgi:hypothetical protein
MKLAAFDTHPDKPKKVKNPKGAKGSATVPKTGATTGVSAGTSAAPASFGT